MEMTTDASGGEWDHPFGLLLPFDDEDDCVESVVPAEPAMMEAGAIQVYRFDFAVAAAASAPPEATPVEPKQSAVVSPASPSACRRTIRETTMANKKSKMRRVIFESEMMAFKAIFPSCPAAEDDAFRAYSKANHRIDNVNERSKIRGFLYANYAPRDTPVPALQLMDPSISDLCSMSDKSTYRAFLVANSSMLSGNAVPGRVADLSAYKSRSAVAIRQLPASVQKKAHIDELNSQILSFQARIAQLTAMKAAAEAEYERLAVSEMSMSCF